MPSKSKEEEYAVSTARFSNTSGDGTTSSGTDLAVIEVTHKAQLTEVDITGDNSELYDVKLRDQDASNPSTERTYVGSDIQRGDFEDPAVPKIGANREVAVTSAVQLADANYALNVTVHELQP